MVIRAFSLAALFVAAGAHRAGGEIAFEDEASLMQVPPQHQLLSMSTDHKDKDWPARIANAVDSVKFSLPNISAVHMPNISAVHLPNISAVHLPNISVPHLPNISDLRHNISDRLHSVNISGLPGFGDAAVKPEGVAELEGVTTTASPAAEVEDVTTTRHTMPSHFPNMSKPMRRPHQSRIPTTTQASAEEEVIEEIVEEAIEEVSPEDKTAINEAIEEALLPEDDKEALEEILEEALEEDANDGGQYDGRAEDEAAVRDALEEYMKPAVEEADAGCGACVQAFADAGGCALIASRQDPTSLIPAGCSIEQCGEEMGQFCHSQPAPDVQRTEMGPEEVVSSSFTVPLFEEAGIDVEIEEPLWEIEGRVALAAMALGSRTANATDTFNLAASVFASVRNSTAIAVRSAVNNATASVRNHTSNALDSVRNGTANALDNVRNSTSNALDSVRNTSVVDVLDSVRNTTAGVIEDVRTANVSDVLDSVVNSTANVVQNVQNRTADVINRTADVISDVSDALQNVSLGNLTSDMVSVVRDTAAQVFENINVLLDAVGPFLTPALAKKHGMLMHVEDIYEATGVRGEESAMAAHTFQGDMVPDSDSQLELFQSITSGKQGPHVAAGKPWTGGIVKYCFASDVGADVQGHFLAAVAQVERATCLQFENAGWQFGDSATDSAEQRCSESPAIFVMSRPDYGCYSVVGESHLPSQQLQLQHPGCTTQGVILHEIGHALGMAHEHARPDRDEYIQVNWDNIEPEWTSAFNITQDGYTDLPYEYLSLMHYDPYAFSKERHLPTIQAAGGHGGDIGQRNGFAEADIDQLIIMYQDEVPGCAGRQLQGSSGCVDMPGDRGEGICAGLTVCGGVQNERCCACGGGVEVQCYVGETCPSTPRIERTNFIDCISDVTAMFAANGQASPDNPCIVHNVCDVELQFKCRETCTHTVAPGSYQADFCHEAPVTDICDLRSECDVWDPSIVAQFDNASAEDSTAADDAPDVQRTEVGPEEAVASSYELPPAAGEEAPEEEAAKQDNPAEEAQAASACGDCIQGFADAGGCDAILSGQDPTPMVPQGCAIHECGQEMGQFCHSQPAPDVQQTEVGDEVEPSSFELPPAAEEAVKEAAKQQEAAEEAAKAAAKQQEAAEEATKEAAKQQEAAEEAAKEAAKQQEATEEAAKEAAKQQEVAEEAAKEAAKQQEAAEEAAKEKEAIEEEAAKETAKQEEALRKEEEEAADEAAKAQKARDEEAAREQEAREAAKEAREARDAEEAAKEEQAKEEEAALEAAAEAVNQATKEEEAKEEQAAREEEAARDVEVKEHVLEEAQEALAAAEREVADDQEALAAAQGAQDALMHEGCLRPEGFCMHPGSTYVDDRDCDGDCIPDPYCSDDTEQLGFYGSASSCASTWPAGECKPADPSKCGDAPAAEPVACLRPDGFCTHPGAVFDGSRDCDGDGIADPYCYDNQEQLGFYGSAGGCESSWPGGACDPHAEAPVDKAALKAQEEARVLRNVAVVSGTFSVVLIGLTVHSYWAAAGAAAIAA